jgi:hypothetical protein
MVAACGRSVETPLACQNQWISDASGASTLINPSEAELVSMQDALQAPGRIVCVHRLPSGRTTLVQAVDGQLQAVEVEMGSDGYAEVSRSLIANFD